MPSRSRTPSPSHTVHAVGSSHSVHHIGSTHSVMSAARNEACEWSSVVKSHKLTLEHAAVDINTDRVLYHMELEFATPLPQDALEHGQFLCLSWPYGGLWKIERVREKNTKVSCLSWRKTDLTSAQVEVHARQVDALARKVEDQNSSLIEEESSVTDSSLLEPEEEDRVSATSQPSAIETEDLPTLFEWKMACGVWATDSRHWFIHDVESPRQPSDSAHRRQLLARLLVGFAPLEAQIEVNGVTAIDTVAQTYSADVTWQVTLPAITTFREDAALLEFLLIVDIDAGQFEFSNITEMKTERDLSSSVTPAGHVQFNDLVPPGEKPSDRLNIEPVFHLQFSRHVTASFTEEMALHSFPFDRQKLVFELTTGSSGMPDGALKLIPTPVDPGSFSVENFQLGNVFDVAYHNRVFVSDIKESGPRKTITFEMVLERQSMYYITNVALIAAIITYLCFFVSWAPKDQNGNFMEIGTRIQNATAMVLTAVTFKNQVASLIPQIAYFTILDSYVFVCFIVTSLVTIENALFPLFAEILPSNDWQGSGLLPYSLFCFTIVNIVWAAYLRRWLNRRRYAARVLLQVQEYIRVITQAIPPRYRAEVLHRYLETQKYDDWCCPHYLVTSNGDIHIQAPDDRPVNDAKKLKSERRMEKRRTKADNELTVFQKIFFEMRPPLDRHSSAPELSSPVAHSIPAAKTSAAVYQAGERRLSHMSSVAALMGHATSTRRRTVSVNNSREDTIVNIESFRRYRDAKFKPSTVAE